MTIRNKKFSKKYKLMEIINMENLMEILSIIFFKTGFDFCLKFKISF